jgi:hypothetical protein
MSARKYWVAVISKAHTLRGVEGGFIQVCHGKEAPLKRMQVGDKLLVYSPKLIMEGKEAYQRFTAVGEVSDDRVYPFSMSENFIPFRRNITFYECKETPIRPLIPELEFIADKRSWGFPFRFGFFEITERDFHLIVANMLTDVEKRYAV